jgi:hypothetical protein
MRRAVLDRDTLPPADLGLAELNGSRDKWRWYRPPLSLSSGASAAA